MFRPRPGAWRFALLAVGVWTIISALFAMHGLPMAQPHALDAGSAPMSMLDTNAGAVSHHAVAAPLADRTDGTVAVTVQVMPQPMVGCAEGGHCSATLRQTDSTPVLAAITASSPAPLTVLIASARPADLAAAARPPDLHALQISRT